MGLGGKHGWQAAPEPGTGGGVRGSKVPSAKCCMQPPGSMQDPEARHMRQTEAEREREQCAQELRDRRGQPLKVRAAFRAGLPPDARLSLQHRGGTERGVTFRLGAERAGGLAEGCSIHMAPVRPAPQPWGTRLGGSVLQDFLQGLRLSLQGLGRCKPHT